MGLRSRSLLLDGLGMLRMLEICSTVEHFHCHNLGAEGFTGLYDA